MTTETPPTETDETPPTETDETPPTETPPTETSNDKAKTKARHLPVIPIQPPVILRAVADSNDLLKKLCELPPTKTDKELFTDLTAAAATLSTKEELLESVVRLMEGLGLCRFIYGRGDRPSRVVWLVGNINDVLTETTADYTIPSYCAAPSKKPLTAVLKLSVTSEQRALLCKEIGCASLDKAGLKEWCEELLKSAIAMLEESSEEATSTTE